MWSDMKVIIKHNYGGAVERFEGEPEQVHAQLSNRFPWLQQNEMTLMSSRLNDDLAKLGETQAYSVEIEP